MLLIIPASPGHPHCSTLPRRASGKTRLDLEREVSVFWSRVAGACQDLLPGA